MPIITDGVTNTEHGVTYDARDAIVRVHADSIPQSRCFEFTSCAQGPTLNSTVVFTWRLLRDDFEQRPTIYCTSVQCGGVEVVLPRDYAQMIASQNTTIEIGEDFHWHGTTSKLTECRLFGVVVNFPARSGVTSIHHLNEATI